MQRTTLVALRDRISPCHVRLISAVEHKLSFVTRSDLRETFVTFSCYFIFHFANFSIFLNFLHPVTQKSAARKQGNRITAHRKEGENVSSIFLFLNYYSSSESIYIGSEIGIRKFRFGNFARDVHAMLRKNKRTSYRIIFSR